MLTTDRVAGAALVLVALLALWDSRGLPLGTLHNPGPAYVPVLLAGGLLVLGALIAATGRRAARLGDVGWPEWRHVLAIVAVCAFAAWGLERLGYRLTITVSLLALLGLYGTLHMAMELLSHAAGITLRHVPHSSAAPALTAILGGHVEALASGPAVVLPHIKAGKLRPLAGWGEHRVAALPDVPTFRELGYPGAEFYIWAGLFAPRGTPEPVLGELRETLRVAVADPDFKVAMDNLETPIAFKQGEEFRRFFDTDARRLAAGVRRVGKVEPK